MPVRETIALTCMSSNTLWMTSYSRRSFQYNTPEIVGWDGESGHYLWTRIRTVCERPEESQSQPIAKPELPRISWNEMESRRHILQVCIDPHFSSIYRINQNEIQVKSNLGKYLKSLLHLLPSVNLIKELPDYV